MIGNSYSEWKIIKSGVPQGSIIGPLLFNIFINDLFYVIENCTLYNYADDNTLAYSHHDTDVLTRSLEMDVRYVMDWFRVNCLVANPDKFQCITLGDQKESIKLNIEGVDITPSEKVKVLGITLDNELEFDYHVSDICRKAARQLNVLKHVHQNFKEETRMMIYRSFILSNFNYCPIVWHFCGIQNTRKMEKIQERALRFVYKDFTSTYDQLLKKGTCDMLYVSRLKMMAVEVYKIVNGIGPKYLTSLIEEDQGVLYNFRNNKILIQPTYNTVTYGLNSFRYKAPKIWNNLPNEIKNAVSIKEFKKLIKNWTGHKCYCTMCSRLLE